MSADVADDLEQNLTAEQVRVSQNISAPRLPSYKVVRLIGSGRYGTVWEAIDEQTGATVAIKRLRLQPAGISHEETDKLARLSSARGIVALRELHLDDEPYCYVMEHVAGGTLADEIRDGKLSYARALEIFKELTAALAYVHKDGIVHCDLKPANILLDTKKLPRIGDFGQARGLAPDGTSIGTRFYMPPEQAGGGVPADPRWDVYALGATFYEMLTGQPPRFNAELDSRLGSNSGTGTAARRNLELYARYLESAPPPSDHRCVHGMDPGIARLIDRCLTTNLDDRPQDAAEVERLISECEQAARLKKLERFGGWAPAIMLMVVGVVLLVAGSYISNTLTEVWTKHVNESNGAVAEAIAINLKRQFDSRLANVEDESKKLVEMLKKEPAENDPDVQTKLKALYQLRKGTDKVQKRFARWTLANEHGKLLYNFGAFPDPARRDEPDSDEATNGRNYAWRGWFNGVADGDKADEPRVEDLESFRRRTGRFVSQPYCRDGNFNFSVISFSHPIVEEEPDDSGNLVPKKNWGVLSGQVFYNDFLAEVNAFVDSEIGKSIGIDVVIVNQDQQVIYNRKLSDQAARHEPFVVERQPSLFQYAALFPGDAAKRNINTTKPYAEVADQREYIAFSRTIDLERNNQRFAVIVQQKRSSALAPLNTIRGLALGAILALIGVGGLCLWINVQALRREAAAHA